VAITFTQKVANKTETDAESYITASTTFTAGKLYLVCVKTTKTSATAPTSVATTGGAITFTQVTSRTLGGNNTCISVYRAVPSLSVTDTVLITLASSTSCTWHIVEVTGADTSGSNGANAIVQTAHNLGTTTALTVTLTNNIVAGNARFTYSGVQQEFSGHTVSSGTWDSGTPQSHASPPGIANYASNVNPATTDKSAIWTPGAGSSLVAGIIIELAAASAWSVGMIPV
jgi:hypothetical protein